MQRRSAPSVTPLEPAVRASLLERARRLEAVGAQAQKRLSAQSSADNPGTIGHLLAAAMRAIAARLGGSFAKQYGGLTAIGAAADILRDSRAGFAITGVGSRTFLQAAATGAATLAVNGVLIKGSFDAGVLAGSILRTGINRAASAAACTARIEGL